ncbi:MAG TPA: carbohydrate kinase family protein [Bryobacteraceae bacterium]|jgi:sugar/nucleoside kinase (ribokinase family)
MSLDVLAAGELYVDLVMSGFDFWPQPGQEAFAREFRREIGGGAAITACGLAALGRRTGVFGIVGGDHHAWITGRFQERGVETDRIAIDAAEPTAFTVAVSAPQDRAFFTYLGANRGLPQALTAAARGPLEAHHVHLALAPDWETARALFDAIHANGATVSLDAGWHEGWLADPRAVETISKLDIFFPNETEAARMTGETDPERMLRRFAEAGARCVAVKLGAAGAALLRDSEIYFEKPPAVTPCDTTGAGDCFDAGFLDAWMRGESAQVCLRTANICGALSCEAYGGIDGFPSSARLAQELEKLACKR